jgi:hypothetical protein
LTVRVYSAVGGGSILPSRSELGSQGEPSTAPRTG